MNSTEMAIKSIARDYFSAFSKKDLNKLKQFFSRNISLRDWETLALGRDEVCQANKIFFDTVATIDVDLINIFVDGYNLIGDLIITIDSKETIKVVDIIEFDQDLKIISIKAYKG